MTPIKRGKAMNRILKALVFAVCLISVGAQAESPTDLEPVQRASQEKIQELSSQIHALKAKQAHSFLTQVGLIQAFDSRDCGDRPPQPPRPRPPEPRECVKNCISRFSSGSCASYGPDYCAPAASCAANCISRFSSGSCASYGADVCGPYASCSPNCISRFSSGSCASYGPDVCN